MSFFFDLARIGQIYEKECTNFEDSYVSGFFLAYDYWPVFIGMIIIGLTLEHKEVFYVLVFWGGFANSLINWGLRAAIGQPGPESCFPSDQMPAYATDGVTFLAVVVMLSSGYIYGVPIRWFKLSLVWMGGPVAVYARVWLRANTGPQLLAGSASGLVQGLLYCALLKFVFTYKRIDAWFLRHNKWWLGSDYEETLIRPDRPVFVLRAPPETMCAKLNSAAGTENALVMAMVERCQEDREEMQKLRDRRRVIKEREGIDERVYNEHLVPFARGQVRLNYWDAT